MSKRVLGTLAAVAILVALAAVTNPSPERHRDKIREAIAERSPMAKVLGLGALAAFASNYHSLGIVSYTKAGDKVLSVGFLGMVFVADAD